MKAYNGTKFSTIYKIFDVYHLFLINRNRGEENEFIWIESVSKLLLWLRSAQIVLHDGNLDDGIILDAVRDVRTFLAIVHFADNLRVTLVHVYGRYLEVEWPILEPPFPKVNWFVVNFKLDDGVHV